MQTQEILLAIFTGILAVSVLMQTLIFFGIFKAIRRLTNGVHSLSKDLMKNVEVVTGKAEETLTTIRDLGNEFRPVKDKIVDAAEIVHERIVRVDEFLEETTNTARMEVQSMKDRIESATNRTEELLNMMHDRILAPVNEIYALTRGIRAGFDILFRRRRSTSAEPHQDEEMFI
jgi:methyl-accepting chemotaxis protein